MMDMDPPEEGEPVPRVVLLSGRPVALSTPPGPQESVGALRRRVAAAMGLDVERVLLVAGSRVLQNNGLVADGLRAAQCGDVLALVTEAIMDTDDPQHVAEYASEIFRGYQKRDCAGTLAAMAPSALSASPSAASTRSSALSGLRALSSSSAASSPAPSAAPTTSAVGGSPTPSGDTMDTTPPSAGREGGRREAAVDRVGRGVLADWLVEEGQKYNLRAETIFLMVAIVDAFLQRRNIAERDLRLVGVAGMLIAAKFEEIYPPEIRDLVYITNSQYEVEDIKKMEVLILGVLQFGVAGQTMAHFMERFRRANPCSEVQGRVVQYILELALVDNIAVQQPPYRLAAAAVLLSNRLAGQLPAWPASMENYTGQSEAELADCATELQALLSDARHGAFQRARNNLSKDPPLWEMVQAIEDALSTA